MSGNESLRSVFTEAAPVFKSLIKSGAVHTLTPADKDPEGCLKSYINEDVTIFIKVVGVIDIKLEIERVGKRNAQLDKLREGIQKKIDMKGYEKKVPEAVRNENIEKLKNYQTEIDQNLKGITDL